MMLCPDYPPAGVLLMFENSNFTRLGSVDLPGNPYGDAWLKFLYLGGDAVAMLGSTTGLQILHAPIIGSPP